MSRDCLFPREFCDENKAAFIQVEQRVTFGELNTLTKIWENSFSTGGFALLRIGNDIESLSAYVALMQSGIPTMLIDREASPEYEAELIQRFKPRFLVGSVNFEGRVIDVFKDFKHPPVIECENWAKVSKKLCMLLGTSGSTGSPKFVRLSHEAVSTNARDIADMLSITNEDVGITSLPPSYTYGLSVINSHLAVGAAILVTDSGVTTVDFWKAVSTHNVTSFAGVPTTYTMLRQMRWSLSDYPSLKYSTQAGGRLLDEDRHYFWKMFENLSKSFIVMYGQTEATARISITPHAMLKNNISTAGVAVNSGSLTIKNKNSVGIGEIIFRGPNVMMGYAESEVDLTLDDVLQGVLETGDLGYLKDNLLFITGRSKRIVKIFGIRVSLDDVDAWLTNYGSGVAVQASDKICVFMTYLNEKVTLEVIRQDLAKHLSVNIRGVNTKLIQELPLLNNGKIDAVKLQELA